MASARRAGGLIARLARMQADSVVSAGAGGVSSARGTAMAMYLAQQAKEQQEPARLGSSRAFSSRASSSAVGSINRGFASKSGGSSSSSSSESSDSDGGYTDELLGESWPIHVRYPSSQVRVGARAPFFNAPAVVDGEITKVALSDYKGKYVCLFFYPKDFTFVCPTEIIAFSDRAKEFAALNCQLIAASTDTEETHLAWIRTPRNRGGLGFMQIPILADTTKEISARYGVLIDKLGIALRGLFIINPQGVVQHVTINDLPIGRSVDEALRTLQAIQYHAEHGEVCPANWKPGSKTMVADSEKSLDYFASVPASEDDPALFGAKARALRSKAEYEALTQGPGPVVVDFYAPWCGKCRQIGPFIDTLVDKYPGVTFAKFDTTAPALEALAGDLGVKALPTFKFFKGGKEAASAVSGYKKKPLEDAVAALAK